MKYNPTTHSIELGGVCIDKHNPLNESEKKPNAIVDLEAPTYNSKIFLNNGVESILHQNLLEKHEEQQLK